MKNVKNIKVMILNYMQAMASNSDIQAPD